MTQSFAYEPKVRRIRLMMDKLDSYRNQDRLFEVAADLFGLDLDLRLNANVREKIFSDFLKDQSREITPKLGKKYTDRLFANLSSCGKLSELFETTAPLFEREAQVLTPIFVSFWKFVFHSCAEKRIKRILVAATDANAIYLVGKSMQPVEGAKIKSFELFDLGRKILNISDEVEVAHDRKTPEGYKYGPSLRQLAESDGGRYLEFLRSERETAVIDGECYGSILRILIKLGWRMSVYLMASNNPYLHGYLNKVVEFQNLTDHRVPSDIIWKIGDNIEGIPRPYKIRELSRNKATYILKSDDLSPIYSSMGMLSYWFFAKEARTGKNNSRTIQEAVSVANEELNNSSSLLLPNTVREWSRAGEFLRLWSEEGLGFVDPQVEYIANTLLRV